MRCGLLEAKCSLNLFLWVFSLFCLFLKCEIFGAAVCVHYLSRLHELVVACVDSIISWTAMANMLAPVAKPQQFKEQCENHPVSSQQQYLSCSSGSAGSITVCMHHYSCGLQYFITENI
jgi:hypothetical protein